MNTLKESGIKIMSIGSGCPTTSIIRDLGIREAGPIDWTLEDQSINHLTLDLFSGNLFSRIVTRNWDTTTNFDIGKDGNAGYEVQVNVCGGSFIHEDIAGDTSQWKKELYRLLRFEKWVRSSDPRFKFIRQIWSADIESPTGLKFFIDYLEYHKIDKNRILFISDLMDDKEKVKSIADNCGITIHMMPAKSIDNYIDSDNETKVQIQNLVETFIKSQWPELF